MENWKPVKDFEGVYEVSDLGRVRRLKGGKGATVGTVVKAHPQQGGYLLIHLRDIGRDVQKLLHIIVAEAFVPNTLGLPEVNHLGDKGDCRASMLEWRSKAGHTAYHLKKSPVKNVRFNKDLGKWTARLGRKLWLGAFTTKQEAQAARKAAVEAIPNIL